MSADGKVFGIIKPHHGPDAERFLLELRGVVFRDSLRPGTEIRSSGQGSVFPRGIPIGTVVQDITTSSAYARTYLVRPAVMPADVTVADGPAADEVEPRVGVEVAGGGFDHARPSVRAAESVTRARRDTMPGDSTRRRP